MNCFDFQNRASDYLDEALAPAEAGQFKEHAASCPDCESRIEHFRSILERIADQPKSAPPVAIGKLPAIFSLRPSGMTRTGKTIWRSIPWYLRTTIEGVSVVLLVLAAVSTGPKLRMLYERSIERSMTEFNETFNDPLLSSSEMPPLVRGSSAGAPLPGSSAEDEFQDDAEVIPSEEGTGTGTEIGTAASDVRVGNSEIWRFNLKTDSPHEIRPRVVQILSELKVPAATPGLGGIEAPGGIQFDLLISQTSVSALKRQLEKIAPRAPLNSPVGETFAWYKNKSRRTIPAGKTRVVIWLSQM